MEEEFSALSAVLCGELYNGSRWAVQWRRAGIRLMSLDEVDDDLAQWCR